MLIAHCIYIQIPLMSSLVDSMWNSATFHFYYNGKYDHHGIKRFQNSQTEYKNTI